MLKKQSIRVTVIAALIGLFMFIPSAFAQTETIPTIHVTEVVMDTSVTISTQNYPANQTFTVTMGGIGTQGIDGIEVGTFDSGDGGNLTVTFDIPDELVGQVLIAIRAETAHAQPYFSYNWFVNQTQMADDADDADDDADDTDDDADDADDADDTGDDAEPEDAVDPDDVTAIPVPADWEGPAVIDICSVERDSSVTLDLSNLPVGQNFVVRMGDQASLGEDGTIVDSFEATADSQFVTVSIPADVQGDTVISVRIETTHAFPIYAYGYFYNLTTGACDMGES